MRLLHHASLPAIHPQAALKRYDPFQGSSVRSARIGEPSWDALAGAGCHRDGV
ncbi:MAG: hypothetical protein ACXWWW_11825 [Candidatus Deferrimicrobiaceae bacterium]